ncbi:MAG: amino acid permease [Micrococcales bacterium]|nr:amino acid permease [Micrococcales bacterium]
MAGHELQKGALKQRHLTMIAIGGVIGAGLFVGSGVVIGEVGPGAWLTYALSGVLIILVMRMLGEMAANHPSTGSFSDYARRALGDWAGFSTAWLYWYFWVIVVGFEAVAGAKILNYWLNWDDSRMWILALILMVLMTATNLFSTSSFGEFEYWFASIKVATIIIFLLLGTMFILGLWPGADPDFSNLTKHGGFLPNGGAVIFTSIVVVIFSMVGAEIATIAAAESDDPERAVTKATASVVWRIAAFFIGSIFLLCTMLPWDSKDLATSPYVSAFKLLGIPYADHIMNAVVLTAVLSCLNSGLYTASRMLFVLAGRREAPAAMLRVSARGVPLWSILFSTVVGFLCVIAAYLSPDTVFLFLLNSSGAVILFVYILIAVSQYVLRRRSGSEGLKVRMWGFPVLTWLAIAGMVAVLVSMALDPEARSQVVLGLGSWALLLVAFAVMHKVRARNDVPDLAEGAVPGAHRVLVVANEDVAHDELVAEVHRIRADDQAEYYVTVPSNPVATHTADLDYLDSALTMRQATLTAAHQRLDTMLEMLRSDGHTVDGSIGHFDPIDAMADAVDTFRPDAIVVATTPTGDQPWRADDTVRRARRRFDIPVHHLEHVSGVGATERPVQD